MSYKFSMPFLLSLLLPVLLLAREETYSYEVRFLFLPAVKIEMNQEEHSDTGRVTFYTETYGWISRLLEVHNVYTTWYDPADFSVLQYYKDIDQTNVKQTLKGYYYPGRAFFSNNRQVRLVEPRVHNIFSTLLHLRRVEFESLDTLRWITEVEGKQYYTAFQLMGYEKVGSIKCARIKIIWEEVYRGQKGVIGPTDVFSYEVVNPEGERYIWIETGERRRIIKAAFSLKPFWLVAILLPDQ